MIDYDVPLGVCCRFLNFTLYNYSQVTTLGSQDLASDTIFKAMTAITAAYTRAARLRCAMLWEGTTFPVVRRETYGGNETVSGLIDPARTAYPSGVKRRVAAQQRKPQTNTLIASRSKSTSSVSIHDDRPTRAGAFKASDKAKEPKRKSSQVADDKFRIFDEMSFDDDPSAHWSIDDTSTNPPGATPIDPAHKAEADDAFASLEAKAAETAAAEHWDLSTAPPVEEEETTRKRLENQLHSACQSALESCRNGQFAEAVELATTALSLADSPELQPLASKLEPYFLKAYSCRAHAHFNLDAPDSAISDLTAAIKLKPDSGSLYAARGKIFLAQQKYQEAIQDFTHPSLDQDSLAARAGLGEARLRLQQYDEAARLLQAALMLAPSNPNLNELFEEAELKMLERVSFDAVTKDFEQLVAQDMTLPLKSLR